MRARGAREVAGGDDADPRARRVTARAARRVQLQAAGVVPGRGRREVDPVGVRALRRSDDLVLRRRRCWRRRRACSAS